jgi:hypothetical protein
MCDFGPEFKSGKRPMPERELRKSQVRIPKSLASIERLDGEKSVASNQ